MSAVKVVCDRCGGYGVTLRPDPNPDGAEVGTRHPCDHCDGAGFHDAEPWEGWQPDPDVVAMIATYTPAWRRERGSASLHRRLAGLAHDARGCRGDMPGVCCPACAIEEGEDDSQETMRTAIEALLGQKGS